MHCLAPWQLFELQCPLKPEGKKKHFVPAAGPSQMRSRRFLGYFGCAAEEMGSTRFVADFGVCFACLLRAWVRPLHTRIFARVRTRSRALDKRADEKVWQLCKNVNEADVSSVLLPEIVSKKNLPQILKIFSQGKQGKLAFATLEAVRTDGRIQLKAPNYTVGISTCAKSKLWKEALTLLQSMYHATVEQDIISRNAAISACEKGGQWQEALNLFDAMPKDHVEPNVISYSATISACEKAGQWQEALVLFQAMSESKVERNIISYSGAITACEKVGQWKLALELFAAMPKENIWPDVIGYNAAIAACEKGRQWQEALTFLTPLSCSPSIVFCGGLSR